MKKTSLILILIFSVFFSYKVAFALTPIQYTPQFTNVGGDWYIGEISPYTGIATVFPNTTGYLPYYFNSGINNEDIYAGHFGDMSTLLFHQHLTPGNTVLPNKFETINHSANTHIPYGVGTYTIYWDNGTNQVGYEFSKDATDAPITTPADGISSQITPSPGATVSYNVTFSGTWTSSGLYNQICANFTTTDASLKPICFPLQSMSGVNMPYSFQYVLSPNHTYSYTLKLFDGTNYTTATSPVSFSTSALINNMVPVWQPESCTWTDFSTWTGCLDNVFHDLFSPSPDSLNQFQGLYTTYLHKPPFGYIVAIQTSLGTINDTNTSVFTLQSLPILNTYIFDPMRLALSWVLWVAFAFVLYHRVKNIKL